MEHHKFIILLSKIHIFPYYFWSSVDGTSFFRKGKVKGEIPAVCMNIRLLDLLKINLTTADNMYSIY